jgi:predicted nucleotidyltransferase
MNVNLTNPFESILPANDAAVFRTLSRLEAPISGRQAHKLIGSTASYSGVRLALARLAAVGLLTVTREDYATLYSLNREHLLLEPLTAIMATRETLVRRIRDHFNLETDIRDATTELSISFFGSVATNESSAGSDIDLAIVYENDRDREARQGTVSDLVEKLESWTGNAVDLYDITRDELSKMVEHKDPLIGSWGMSSEPIIGPSLPELIRRGLR